MPSKDISRHLFQPRKRYAGVRMQQGRVILDSDWNESEGIDDEDARRALVDIIGPRGTSNDGFRIRDVTYNGGPGYDFTFDAGSYYVGGLRVDADDEGTFLGQDDWVRIEADPARLPRWPEVDELQEHGGVRNDLVYLHVWEQPVSAVEDSELVERALGGPDTSVRMRRMRRIEVLPSLSSNDCNGVLAELADAVAGSIAPASVDEATGEVIGTARLRIDALPDGVPDDPCRPAVRGGFLGAENETLRVELVGPDRFIWGRDNAAPLYRVVLEQVGGAWTRIRFLTRPRDQAAFPLKGQAVEILPWGAVLPSREKVSELQGHLSRVAVTYTPDAGGDYIDLETAVPASYQAWMDEHGSRFESERDGEHPQYFFLRVWTGANPAADGPSTRFEPGLPVALGQTGLQATFSHRGLPGQYWVAAARPHTPDQVVPWDLSEGAPPAGTRHFYAPLALIRWTTDGESVYSEVEDCRDWFPPLTRVRGCCTITVGDGMHSRGHVRTIAEALARLPREGGTICLLPGVYRERVRLVGRRNVTIEGCGDRSIITNPAKEPGYGGTGLEPPPAPLVEIVGGSNITIRTLAFETVGVMAIQSTIPPDAGKGYSLDHVTIEAVRFVLGSRADSAGVALGAIDIAEVDHLSIHDCTVTAARSRLFAPGPWPAIRASGNRVVVARNEITSQSWTGIQLGFAQHAVVEDNVIEGSGGHGITLGAIRYIPADSPVSPSEDDEELRIPVGVSLSYKGMLDLEPKAITIGDRSYYPDGELGRFHGLRVSGNYIGASGGSGIAPAMFPESEFVDVVIADNELAGYLFNDVLPHAADGEAMAGGIVLSFVDRSELHGNRLDKVEGHARPVVGIGIGWARRVSIADNRIRHVNADGRGDVTGPRAGIRVRTAETSYYGGFYAEGGYALAIHRNYVVQWVGRALWVRNVNVGELDIQDNFFESHGLRDDDIHGTASYEFGHSASGAAGACVEVAAFGESHDRYPWYAGPNNSSPIRFDGNDVRLIWSAARPDCVSAMFKNITDGVSLHDNRFTVLTSNSAVYDQDGQETVDRFVWKVNDGTRGVYDRHFVTFDVLVASETFHVGMNRFSEGPLSAAASLFAMGHNQPSGGRFGLAAVDNQATHCLYTIPNEESLRTQNQVRYPVNENCSYYSGDYYVSLTDPVEQLRARSLDRTAALREQVERLRANRNAFLRRSLVSDTSTSPDIRATTREVLASFDERIGRVEADIAEVAAAKPVDPEKPLPLGRKPTPGTEPTGGGTPPAES